MKYHPFAETCERRMLQIKDFKVGLNNVETALPSSQSREKLKCMFTEPAAVQIDVACNRIGAIFKTFSAQEFTFYFINTEYSSD